MIARIIYLLILLILLPDWYIEQRFLKPLKQYTLKWRLLWWIPAFVMLVYSISLALSTDFIPNDIRWIKVFFVLIGLLVVPKAVFSLISFIGWNLNRLVNGVFRVGNLLGIVIGILCGASIIYGVLVGPKELKVTHVTIESSHLPKAFDGLRIVVFSDAHVGTFNNGWESVLDRDIDSILAQKPNVICFVGDLQNTQPSELQPNIKRLRRLAQSGVPVYSVLGNHDYSKYISGDSARLKACERGVIEAEKAMGWHLLRNENTIYYSKDKKDSIVFAGEENGGDGKHFPNYANLKKALRGVNPHSFIILLQHDPKSWSRRIVKKSNVDVTLSGHTHGGQISIFGLRPTLFTYPFDYGLAKIGSQSLYVTCGIGGLAPIRIGVEPEIAVITLHANATK